MRLPEIADELRRLAKDFSIPRLADLAEEIRRRPILKRADAVSAPMTPWLAEEIRAYADAHPDLSQLEIAETFNVNQGRVSEVLRGKRQ